MPCKLPASGRSNTTCRPQIKLLKLLGLLGAGDQSAAENMYGVVGAAMQKAALHGELSLNRFSNVL